MKKILEIPIISSRINEKEKLFSLLSDTPLRNFQGLKFGCINLGNDHNLYLYFLNQEKYFKNVTYDQLIDGLDIFFSDYKNRCIETNSGIFVVLKMIRGGSKDEINTMIETLRSFPIEKEKALRELREKN